MVWRNGVFVPVSAPSSLDQTIAERRVENRFLDLLDQYTKQGQQRQPASDITEQLRPGRVRQAQG